MFHPSIAISRFPSEMNQYITYENFVLQKIANNPIKVIKTNNVRDEKFILIFDTQCSVL